MTPLASTNRFTEGGDAYRAWLDRSFVSPLPEAPYPAGSIEAEQWGQGFNDAMNWQLYGQYE